MHCVMHCVVHSIVHYIVHSMVHSMVHSILHSMVHTRGCKTKGTEAAIVRNQGLHSRAAVSLLGVAAGLRGVDEEEGELGTSLQRIAPVHRQKHLRGGHGRGWGRVWWGRVGWNGGGGLRVGGVWSGGESSGKG